MSPQEARILLEWTKDGPRRHHRYVLEGGTRQEWKCGSGCGCNTEAHTAEEGRANLNHFALTYPAARGCDHRQLVPTGRPMPPIDFS